MSGTKFMSLVVAYYPEEEAATAMLQSLKLLDHAGAIVLVDSAVITSAPEGKLKIHQASERRGLRRITGAAVMGGVLGAIFPPSILAMTAVGSVAAAAWNHFRDHGFEKNLLKEIGENLPPGGAAIAAVVEDVWLGGLESALKDYALLQRYVFDTDSLLGLKLLAREALAPDDSDEYS